MSRITQQGATSPLAIVANGVFQSSSDANLQTLVGTRWTLADSRELVFVGAGASGVDAGNLYQDAALIANHQSLTVTAYQAYSANGNTPAQVTATLGATAATVGQYAGGFVSVVSGTGIGSTLLISTNSEAAASGSIVITLEDGATLDTTSVISLIPAHGANVIPSPTTLSNALVGVGLYTIASGSYGFVLAKGITSAISDASVAAAGDPISPSAATAGTVTQTTSTTTTVNKAIIGYAIYGATSADAYPVYLNL